MRPENPPPTGTDTADDSAGGRGARFLVIAGLCGLAVAQPILDLLGENPTTFQFNRIEPSGIVLFALVVVVVPPVALWALGEVSFAVDTRVGRRAHASIAGVLCALFAVLLTKGVTTNVLAVGIVGVIGLGAGGFASVRAPAFRTWSRLLSLTNPMFLALFVWFSPVADLIWAGTQDVIDSPGGIEVGNGLDESAPSVIMLVFDEWPTQSLLTGAGSIDAVRFPNVAAFAEDATFYPHFTAVSPFTQSAVPALLDGLDPFGGPTWSDHPDSLFSLLGASHHPVVVESITDLCGLPECGLRPTPPPARSGAEAENGDPALVATSEIDTGPQWRRLFDTTVEVWTDRVTPGSSPDTNAFDDFVETITPVTAAGTEAPPTTSDGEPVDNTDLERFLATQVIGQPDRHRLFVEALQPTDEPILGFLHLILPHQPWTLREDGTTYTVAGDRTAFENDNDDPWPVAVSRQRHLLQAEYADRLLGDVLRRLDEIDEYDDSLIVVIGDHGVAFEPGEPSRRVTDANLEQITYAPLFIKAPNQDTSAIDDANLNSTDVTPTIAALLGLTVPWETDGRAVGSADVDARGNEKYVHSFSDAFDYEFLGVVDYDDETAFARLLDDLPAPITADDSRLDALYRGLPGADLIGRSPDELFVRTGGTATVAALDQLEQPESDAPLLGEVSGRVADADAGTSVVVAVNDEIVGVSPLYVRNAEPGHFVVLLPADALDAPTTAPEQNQVRVATLAGDGTLTELTLTGR